MLNPDTGKSIKTVRFADTCNEIPPITEFSMLSQDFSSDETGRIEAEAENRPSSGGRIVQQPGFLKLSPRKNVSTVSF
jgi:hypothetical protein